MSANRMKESDDGTRKFGQIFKNNLRVLDSSGVMQGNMYRYLESKIDATFTSAGEYIDLVNSYFMTIATSTEDYLESFKYDVSFDLGIQLEKPTFLSDN
jgi:hypothetical protein